MKTSFSARHYFGLALSVIAVFLFAVVVLRDLSAATRWSLFTLGGVNGFFGWWFLRTVPQGGR